MSDETERAKEIDEAIKKADAKKRADAEAEAHNGARSSIKSSRTSIR